MRQLFFRPYFKPLFLVFYALCANTLGQPWQQHFELLTTVPENDYDPHVSALASHQPNCLVYVSDIDHNPEIHVLEIRPGTITEPRLIAPSPATDIQPTLSPKQQWLAWVSTREDALGDIWIMPFPSGPLRCVSSRGQKDEYPRWIFQADKQLALQYSATLENDVKKTITLAPGSWNPIDTRPAESVRATPSLPFGYKIDQTIQSAYASSNTNNWVLAVHADDTNGDGALGHPDDASVWRYDAKHQIWRQLTPPLPRLNSPHIVSNDVFLSAEFRHGQDIARISKSFIFADLNSPAAALSSAQNAWNAEPHRPFYAVGLARLGYLLAPSTDKGQACFILALDILRSVKRTEMASLLLQSEYTYLSQFSSTRRHLNYRRTVLEHENLKRAYVASEQIIQKRREAIKHLQEYLTQVDDDLLLKGRVGIELAELLAEDGQPQIAVRQIIDILTDANTPQSLKSEAALTRARIFQTWFPDQAQALYLDIVRKNTLTPETVKQAAVELTHLVDDESPTLDQKVLALRELETQAPQPSLLVAATRLQLGRLFHSAGDLPAAMESFQDVENLQTLYPIFAAQASFKRAELLVQQLRYAEAIDLYESVSEQARRKLYQRAPRFIKLARDNLIQQLQSKGLYELRVNDPHLAAATFAELIQREPNIAEGWRGYLAAQQRLGLLNRQTIAAYRRDSEAKPFDPIASYKYGLSLTYLNPIKKSCIRILKQSIALDGANPYFHQTLGFVYEHFGRLHSDEAAQIKALRSYQRALALIDPVRRPFDYANLLINAGNAALAVGNFTRATSYYQRWIDQGVKTIDLRTEFLVLRARGIALFRSQHPSAAAASFKAALQRLQQINEQDLLPTSKCVELETEMLDRQALALFDSGALKRSAELFALVAKRQTPNSLNRVRALRNQGLALHRLMSRHLGITRESFRRQAETAIQEAYDTLKHVEHSKIKPSSRKREGLFQFDIYTSASATGGALQDIDVFEEGRLLTAALALLDTTSSRQALQEHLATPVKINDGNRAYYLTSRLVMLDRLAVEYVKESDTAKAVATLIEGINITRFSVDDTTHTNISGLARLLTRLQEILLSSTETVSLQALTETWLGQGLQVTDSASLLDSCLHRALAMQNRRHDNAPPFQPLSQARLLMARLLLCERRLNDCLAHPDNKAQSPLAPTDLQVALLSGRIVKFAENIIDLNIKHEVGGELKRLAVLSYGALLRQAYLARDFEQAQVIQSRALSYAKLQGFPHLVWWLLAQATLITETPNSNQMALSVLNELEYATPGALAGNFKPAFDLICHCERLSLKSVISQGDWEEAWSLGERWRVARLRLAFDQALPPTQGATDQESIWLAKAIELRARTRELLLWRQSLPTQSNSPSFDQKYVPLLSSIEQHIQRGREAEWPSALLLFPKASPFADAEFLVAGGLPLPHQCALVLNTPWGCVAWTATERLELRAKNDFYELSVKAPIWLVQAISPLPYKPKGLITIHMLTLETTFAAFLKNRFDTGADKLIWPQSPPLTPLPEELKSKLEYIERLEIPDIDPDIHDPFTSHLGNAGIQLGSILPYLNSIQRIDTYLKSAAGNSINQQRALEECMVATLAYTGISEAYVNSQRWIACRFKPAEIPEIVETELGGIQGTLVAQLQRGDNPNALRSARRLYNLQKASSVPESNLINTATLLAQIEEQQGNYEQALKIAKEIADLIRQKQAPEDLAKALRRVGNIANKGRNFAEALKAYQAAQSIWRNLKNPRELLKATATCGVILENWSRPLDALALYQAAQTQANKLGDHLLEAQQWQRVGRISFRWLNRYAQAEKAYQRASQLAQQSGNLTIKLSNQLNIARIKERLGLYEEAFSITEKVEKLAKESELPVVHMDSLLTQSSIRWARADYLAALQAQTQALSLAQTHDQPAMQIIAFNRGGLIAWSLNDTDKALDNYDKALELALKGLDLGEVAATYNNRGLVYRHLASYPLALADFQQALNIFTEQQNLWGQGYAQRNIGITYFLMGHAPKAINNIQQAIAVSSKIGDRTNLAKALLALGDAQYAHQNTLSARKNYQLALDEAKNIPIPEVSWRALFGLAKLDQNAADTPAALKHLREAIEIVEQLRARIKIEDLQDGFLQDKLQLYDTMIRLLLDNDQFREAFDYSERSRGRSFIDLLGNQQISLHSNADQAAWKKQRSLKGAIENLKRSLQHAEEASRSSLQQRLSEAQRQYSEFQLELKLNHPQLSNFVSVHTEPIQAIQKRLEANTKLLVYHLLPQELVAWIVSPTQLQVTRTSIDRAELAQRITGLRRRLQTLEDVKTELAILSRFLLAANLPHLRGAGQVGIIPHRELHRMPFACLSIDTEHLIDKFAVFYLPSANILQHTYKPLGQSMKPNRVLALGNPDFGSEAYDLPFAQKEAERIVWDYPNTDLLTGAKAMETSLLENAHSYDTIHLATHGEYNETYPLLSSIFLCPDKHNDGQLTAQEIFSLRLNADLVVLSACQSGLGKLSNGDDIIGLNRAFLYAGAPQLISTLWRVNDVSTALLIKHYYRFAKTMPKAEALRQAQRKVRERYPHPSHWAGIFLTGDWK
jgi:CHAT domain-containing protein/tetratricopeptide (TPR) repeat protein